MRPTRILRTIGFRLAAIYAGMFGLSVLVLFGVIYWISGEAMRQQLRTVIDAEVTALYEEDIAGGLAHTADVIERRLASGLHSTTFYLLLDPAGRKVAGNAPLTSPRDGWQEIPLPSDISEDDNDPEDEGDNRLLALGVALPDRSFLLVGQNLYRIVEVEEAIILTFEWAFAVTVVLAVAGGCLLSVGFLRRIDAINRTSQAIVEGRLTERIPTSGTGDEIDGLASNLNEMLDRVQTLMESLRQISSDIAHDLRTPLSRLRHRLEAARLKAGGIADYEAAVDQAIADTDAILKTFAALLRIAQIEAGTRKAAFTPINLSSVFQSIRDAYSAVAEDRGQTLITAIDPDVQVRGDRELLTQMMANLVENAIGHTPPGTRIELSLRNEPLGPVGMVADTGPGIPAESRDKVFRRFFRLEQSRSAPGSGLGLALVAAVAGIHGIAITLADNEPGLKVVLDFAPASAT